MRNAVLIKSEVPFASENIASFYSNFNENSKFVVTSGTAVVETFADAEFSYFGNGALVVDFADNNLVEFFARLELMKTVAKNTGNHILSFALFKNEGSSAVNFKVNVFVNGILDTENTIEVIKTNFGWEIFSQNILLEKDDEVDFTFSAISDEGNFTTLYVDRFSLEFDIQNVGLPYIYSEAKDVPFERNVIIDIPSIPSNTGVTVTALVTGVKIGEVLAMSYPIELITFGIIVGTPIVTDIDEVKFYIFHHGGGTIDPTSGNFKFKKV